MEENLKNSGIDIIGDVPWGTNFCQFYQTKEDLADILVPYFKAGLENNEFCLWVTSQPLEVEEAKEAMRKGFPDIDVYLERGKIEITSYTRGYVNEGVFDSEKVVNGWVKKLDQVLASGYNGLRTAGNTSGLKKGDWDDFVDYEKKVGSNIGKRQMISLCPYFLDMCSAADIIDVAFNHQFALIKREGKWERIENSGLKTITENKQEEEALRQSEQRVRVKLEDILSPSREMANLELADIIDTQAIQSLMDDFYKLVQVPMGLNDLKGNVLVGVGWQDICTKFHRFHPEACKHCVESNIKLSTGISPGEFKMYKCKNNMWDIVTPIMVGGQHIGDIFAGQFFFEDEPLDYELFRSQARQYDFNEKEYIAALEKVPRLSREAVDTGMDFFMTFANMISQLSYSNIKLVQSLAERDTLVDALRQSENRYRMLFNHSTNAIILSDPRDGGKILSANPAACLMLGWAEEELISKGRDVKFDLEDPAVSNVLEELIRSGSAKAHLTYKRKDGTKFPGELSTALFTDSNGEPRVVVIIRDITERKKAEEALKKAHESLEEKIEERTVQLDKAYKSLKESEEGLAEAQKMAHIGNWEWDIVTDEVYWSDELYRIFGRNRQELTQPYDEYLSYVHPDDRDYVDNVFKRATNGKSYSIDHRIILAREEERSVHIQSEVIFDEKNIPIRIKGIVQDITERKKAEGRIQALADAVESSDDAIITETPKGIITSWNKGAEQIYGYSAEEILGKNVSILEPDNLKGEIKQFVENVRQGGKIQRYRTLRLKKDGTIINISITISPVFDA